MLKRPLFDFVIFAICGIYLRLGTSNLMCLVFFFFMAYFISQIVKDGYKRILPLFVLALLLGYLLSSSAEKSMSEDPVENEAVSGIGIVYDIGKTSSGNVKLKVKGTVDDPAFHNETVTLYMIHSEADGISIGDEVKFFGTLTSFSMPSLPTGYHEKLYLVTRGYDAKFYPDTLERTGNVAHNLILFFCTLNEKVQDAFDRHLSSDDAAMVKALVTGDRDDLSQSTKDLFIQAGIFHILCISGLHISFLLFFVEHFLQIILRLSGKKSTPITILFSIFFLLFVGFTPSVIRAVIMADMMLIGKCIGEEPDSMTNLGIAALIILCFQPLYLFDAGFLLSFGTMFGIILIREKADTLHKKETLAERCFTSIGMTARITVFTFPMVAYFYSAISTVSVLTNLILVPFTGVLLLTSVLLGICSFICPPITTVLAVLVHGMISFFETGCHIALSIPYGYLLTGSPTIEETILFYLFFLAVFWDWEDERKAFFTPIVTCILLCICLLANPLFIQADTIAFLSVGQGDATVIITADRRAYVIDGGGVYGRSLGNNTGETVIIPYLESQGITKISGVFVTHPDSDHATGILEILDGYPVAAVYIADYPYEEGEIWTLLQETIAKNEIPLYTIKESDVAYLDDQRKIECLAPQNDQLGADDNMGSLVLRYTYGEESVLLMGDLPQGGEEYLPTEELSAQILKVSHHGSKNATSSAFLDNVNGEVAIISRGSHNIYGHPHEETIERLEEHRYEIYDTAIDGSIFISLRPNTYRVQTMKEW